MSRARPTDRVLFMIDHFGSPLAGTEGHMARLIATLLSEGVECHLGVLTPSAYLSEQGFVCPWTVLGRRRLRSASTWRTVYAFGRRMAQAGYRLAHVFFNDASVLAPPMLACSGIRTIISRRDMGFWYTPHYIRLLRITRHWVAACATNSHAVAQRTVECERIAPWRVRVIHNGVAPPNTPSGAVPELEAIRRAGTTLVGIVANVRALKRIGDLIAAVARLRAQDVDIQAVVIGSGDTNALTRQAVDSGVDASIHFLGARLDIAACLDYLDIGALCSESEGFSNTLAEYMQAGIPTVCTNAGGNPEAIEHGETGLIYEVGDIATLSDHLKGLCNDSRLRASMGRRAAEVAAKRFSIAAMVSAHRELYEAVAAGRLRELDATRSPEHPRHY